MDDLISREKLFEQTAEWEASALEHVGKLDPRNGPEEREEWVRWSAILQERTAFKCDVQDAPSADVDLSGYSDRLWKNAYERGKAEARKTGKWERHYSRPGVYADLCWHCSACGYKTGYSWANTFKFCPNCGAKMEGGGE